MATQVGTDLAVASVNGVALHASGEILAAEVLRQRACMELLRQAAQRDGLLASDDAPGSDGAISVAASAAIDSLLERAIDIPEPADDACRRHHAAQAGKFASGERADVRHILFAVTRGVDVVALRKRAEATLLEVRCHDGTGDDKFASAARQLSNCPTGADGGELGWITAVDCAPEFAGDIFGRAEIGVLPRLVHSRFGLHVVEVRRREAGIAPVFEVVRSAVANSLRQQAFVTALRQYLRVLAGQATLRGIDLDAADSPLLQ